MKRVKIDTAPAGVKNRTGDYMVDIDYYGRQENDYRSSSIVLEKN